MLRKESRLGPVLFYTPDVAVRAACIADVLRAKENQLEG
jgi:hypothetical protein